MTKTPLTVITIGTDTARGCNADDPRNRRHEVKVPTAAMRDCVVCTLPFYSSGAGNVVCLVCKSESTAEFEGEL